MGYLIAALAAPVAGPVLYGVLHDHPKAVRLVDGFVYIAVPALVALQVLPVAWEQRSVLAIVAVGAGLLVPELMERASHVLERHTDQLALVVGLSGLVLHAALEGAAFAPGAEDVATPFALAVTLHRVPVGLIIWWLLRPRYGVAIASGGVALIVAGTLGGYFVGTEVLGDMHGPNLELYQAFVSGSLVHVVFHQGRHDHTHDDHDHHS